MFLTGLKSDLTYSFSLILSTNNELNQSADTVPFPSKISYHQVQHNRDFSRLGDVHGCFRS